MRHALRVYSRDLLDTKHEQNGLQLKVLMGAIVTSAVFFPYDKVVLTFDTGDVLEIREEGQAGDISVSNTPALIEIPGG